jgi:hypothetical protein
MVAGRRLWGEDEQQAAEHHAPGRGDLGVEALGEDGFRAREAGQLGGRVEAGGPVDEQDDRDAQGAEQEDRPTEAGAVAARRDHRERCGQQRDRNQHVGVGVDGGLEADFRGRRNSRQPGVARLAHLDPAVVDELGRDQAGGGGDDHGADRALGADSRACPGRLPHAPGGAAVGGAVGQAEGAEEADRQRPQPPTAPARQPPGTGVERPAQAPQPLRPTAADATGVSGGPDQPRLGRPQKPIHAAIDPACPLNGQGRRRSTATPRRCYYSASLSPLLLRGLPRAREGLFLAPVPVLSGRPLFRSLPLHHNTFTLRPCHVASP